MPYGGRMRPHPKPFLSQVRILRGDLCDKGSLFRIVDEARPGGIFHLTDVTPPAESLENPAQTYKVNFWGSLNILDAVCQLKLDCRLLFVSSPEVYENVNEDDLLLRKDKPLRPVNPYAGSKPAVTCLTDARADRASVLRQVIAARYGDTPCVRRP